MYRTKLFIFIPLTVFIATVYLPLLFILFPWRKSAGPLLLQLYCRICLIVFRVVIEADKRNKKRIKKGIIISNHISFLDIFILSALYRNVFVSKIEVRHYPLIGWIAWLIGTIFLQRDSPEARHKLIAAIAMEAGERLIAIFPQGTTSSPYDPKPFKCGIFKTLDINNKITIYPLTICYEKGPEIAWEKDILIDNVKKVSALRRIYVKIKEHEKITSEDLRNNSISEICATAERKILSGINL